MVYWLGQLALTQRAQVRFPVTVFVQYVRCKIELKVLIW